MRGAAVLALSGSLACAGPAPALSLVRFEDAPPVTRVVPARDVPEPPRALRFMPWHDYMVQTARQADRTLALERAGPALDVNARGEVPRSSWFAGGEVRSAADIRDGPSGQDPPELPLRVVETKSAGASLGFQAEDARGVRYLVKLDRARTPELQVAGHMVVHRLLFALGYRLADDHPIELRREDLEVAPGALRYEGLLEETLTAEDLDFLLGQAASSTTSSGRVWRALASRFVDGEPLGGTPPEGVRADDPNDLVPHERRRSLRGLFPIAAWLDHVDMRPMNTLDVWTSTTGGRHYVEHLLIDFGKALGGLARVDRVPAAGFGGPILDPRRLFGGLFTLGLWVPAWERRGSPELRGVGWFEAEPFDPGAWRPVAPYIPFRARDPNDDLWGALRMARLGEAHLRAAVAAGRYSDPRAARYLVETLRARQRAVLAWAFARRAPLDAFAVEGGQLCFEDWAPLARPGVDAHRLELHPLPVGSGEARRVGRLPAADRPGRRCATLPPPRRRAVARIVTGGDRVTEVHLGRDGRDVVGIVRGRVGAMRHAHP